MKTILSIILVVALLTACTPRVEQPPEKPEEPPPLLEDLSPPTQPVPYEEEIPFKEDTPAFSEEQETEVKVSSIKPDTTPPTPQTLKEVALISDEELAAALSRPLDELETINNSPITWGPGVTAAEQQPVAAVQLQRDYGKHSAYFLMDDPSKVYISIDEGYELGYTPLILDALNDSDVTAVFFVTLGYVQSRPDLVKRMIDEGHIVGNHSSSHPLGGMPMLSTKDMGKDVLYLHNYVKENFGYEMTLFRPPEGTFSLQSLQVVESLGYTSIFWSFAYNDWNPENQMDPREALLTITDRSHPGAIYLLHGVSSTNTTIMSDVLIKLKEKGYIISDWSEII